VSGEIHDDRISRTSSLNVGGLDKREGSVKDKDILGSAEAPLALPERLRTKALEISR